MKKIRIHFCYKHIESPWGGANNFIRALHKAMEATGEFEFAENIDDEYDLLFMNELGLGPANGSKRISLRKIRQIHERTRCKIAVRAVNLLRHSQSLTIKSFFKAWLKDREVIRLTNSADFVIFQSGYQRSFFVRFGYSGRNSAIVHNAAPPVFLNNNPRPLLGDRPLRLVSSTASPRPTKRHDLVSRISEIEAVEVVHMGRWPDAVDRKNVSLRSVLTHEEMIDVYQQAHYLFHPAVKDPCPNAVIEAICAGLPVIYHPGPGSSAEIIGENGFALEEGNLEATVKKGRADYDPLIRKVAAAKDYYNIKRAANQYIEIFRTIYRQ